MNAKMTIISATVVVLLIATIGSADLTDGLVAHWSFDDPSDPGRDDSGNGNHGTLVNGTVWTTGIVNGALRFDGIDDYVETSSKNWGFSTSATVTAWVKTTVAGGGRNLTVFSLAHGDAEDEILLWVWGDGTMPDGTIAIFNHKSGDNWVGRASDSVVNTGEWVFVAGALDGGGSASNLRIFVNGFEETGTAGSSGSPTDITDTTPRAARIGWRPPAHQFWWEIFEGDIDEVRLYNRALSEEEIKELATLMIEAAIDIDPYTLNLKSQVKWITCYIELPQGYDVGDIDISSILLKEQVPAELSPTKIGDYDDDSVLDLMVKFDRFAVQGILEVGDEVEITVTGELTDGTPFEGRDTIRVIDKGGNK